MMSKSLFFAMLLLCLPLAFAEIKGELKLGERVEYATGEGPLIISFVNYAPQTGRATFLINERNYDLLLYQQVNFTLATFTFAGLAGASSSEFHAFYFINNFPPIQCENACINNSFVGLIKGFDSNFTLCKQDCTQGCNLYKTVSCIQDTLFEIDSCGNKTQALGSCAKFCDSCGDCGRNSCTKAFCASCPPKSFCLTEDDCRGAYCVSGICTSRRYLLGDQVCTRGEPCTSTDCTCSNTVQTAEMDAYPVILIHGFASTPSRLKRLQRDLVFDLGYVNGGQLAADSFDCTTKNPRAVYLATYYSTKETLKSRERLSSLIAKFLENSIKPVGPEKSTFVSNFADAVNRVKACANTDKVNVIAHSMGGLVTFSYLFENANSLNINKIVLLGVPSDGGIYGKQSYKLFKGVKAQLGDRQELLRDCSNIGVPSLMLTLMDGRDFIGDCQELQRAGGLTQGQQILDETPGKVHYFTISGKTDDIGDGFITHESTMLDGAVNAIVPCDHFDLKDPVRCPAAYIEIIKDLGYTEQDLKKETFGAQLKEFFLSIWDGITVLFE